MKINLEIEFEKCIYWDYENHTCEHSCHTCFCHLFGNTLRTSEYGVMVGRDRYCTLNAGVHACMIEEIKKGVENE